MKKKLFAIVMTAAMLLMTGCSLSEKVKLGTSGEDGVYGEVARAIEKVLTDEKSDIKLEIIPTAGSAANLRLLSTDYLDMAIAQNDVLNDAYYGTGTFVGNRKYDKCKAVAGLYTEGCQIITRADSDIMTINDLAGKRVSIGEAEAGTEQNARQILSAYGLSDNMLEEINLDYKDAAKKLETGEIDALFCTVATHSPVIMKLEEDCGIRLIGIDEECIDKLINSYKFYTEYTIPAGTYKNQSEDVKTIGVTAVLLASDKLSDKTVSKITEMIFENKEKITSELSLSTTLNEKQATEGISVPFHKGAAEYYKKHGINAVTSVDE